MKTIALPSTRLIRGAAATAALFGALALGYGMVGCGGDEAASGASLMDAGTTDGNDFQPIVPALSDLQAKLNLTPDQSAQMEKVLAAWTEDAADMRYSMHERNVADGADKAPRFGNMREHMADAAAILDDTQLKTFVDDIVAKREARVANWSGKDFSGPRGGAGERFKNGLAERFGLTADQATALRATRRDAGEKMRALHQQYAAGSITAEQLRDGLRDVRVATEASLRKSVGDETFEKMQEARSAMREKRAGNRAENLDRIVDRQADLLARALRLDAATSASVRTALEATVPARKALLEESKGGSVEPEELLYRGIRIETDATDAIRKSLTPEQAARFDTIRRILPLSVRGPHR